MSLKIIWPLLHQPLYSKNHNKQVIILTVPTPLLAERVGGSQHIIPWDWDLM
jgi:hypothetical protein